MVRAGLVGRVAQAHAHLAARLVHRELEALDLHREVQGVAAQPLRDPPRAQGQQLARARPVGDQRDRLEHRLAVAEPQVEAAEVALHVEQPVLHALHDEGDGARRPR